MCTLNYLKEALGDYGTFAGYTHLNLTLQYDYKY